VRIRQSCRRASDLPSGKGGALLFRFLAAFVVLSSIILQANAQRSDPADAVCPRFAAGAPVLNPPELRSHHGVLETTLTFKAAVDATGLTRYCYISENGLQSPTLRAKPGDLLIIHFRNALVPATDVASLPTARIHSERDPDAPCRGGRMSDSTTNLHFHGLSIPPKCHQDEVIHTAIAAGTSFDYRIRIPLDEPSGLYWYHPHFHGVTQKQLQGGASAALVVEGIEESASLAGLPERILVIRDQPLPASSGVHRFNAPSWDLSVNYVPVAYPRYEPATISVKPAERQFWRVVNASANTILDLQIVVGGAPQGLQVYAIDGVPISGGPLGQDDVLLGPGGRAEFVFTTPNNGETAELITRKWDTGPIGDNDPQRPLATISATTGVRESTLEAMPVKVRTASHYATANPTVERRLYFRESGNQDDDDKAVTSGSDNDANTRFYILVDGYKATLFDMNAPPSLVVHQGTVEDWIISNATFEDHVFHIHQLHFQLLEINGQSIKDSATRDTINIAHRSRNAPPPSVKLRMDFRGANVVGTFIYQCHIVAHGEGGMMGAIQVLPPGEPTSVKLLTPMDVVPLRQPITVTAKVAPAGKGGAVPAGTVQFEADGHLEGPPMLLSGGKAARAFSFYSSGIHTVSATYSGDLKYEASHAQQTQISVQSYQ